MTGVKIQSDMAHSEIYDIHRLLWLQFKWKQNACILVKVLSPSTDAQQFRKALFSISSQTGLPLLSQALVGGVNMLMHPMWRTCRVRQAPISAFKVSSIVMLLNLECVQKIRFNVNKSEMHSLSATPVGSVLILELLSVSLTLACLFLSVVFQGPCSPFLCH